MRHLTMIVSIVGVVTWGCGDPHHSASSGQQSGESQLAQEPSKLQDTAIQKGVSYLIINSSFLPGIKRSLDVRLYEKVSEKILHDIALELKSQDSREYERTFISYYLPGMAVGAGAWATTHFDPNLKVRILGLTAEEEGVVVEDAPSDNREVIGRWVDESPFGGSRIEIFREEGKLFVEQVFKDGSRLRKELVEQRSALGRRFDPKAIRTKQKSPHSTPGRKFLKSQLAALDSFKSNPRFHEFGFGIGGPYNSWLTSIQAKRDAAEFNFNEKVAVGALLMIGLEYIKTHGEESDYTRFMRQEIDQAMQDDSETGGSDVEDHWVLDSNGNLQIRDKYGLIATAKPSEAMPNKPMQSDPSSANR